MKNFYNSTTKKDKHPILKWTNLSRYISEDRNEQQTHERTDAQHH